jgi:hypothetical protein
MGSGDGRFHHVLPGSSTAVQMSSGWSVGQFLTHRHTCRHHHPLAAPSHKSATSAAAAPPHVTDDCVSLCVLRHATHAHTPAGALQAGRKPGLSPLPHTSVTPPSVMPTGPGPTRVTPGGRMPLPPNATGRVAGPHLATRSMPQAAGVNVPGRDSSSSGGGGGGHGAASPNLPNLGVPLRECHV